MYYFFGVDFLNNINIDYNNTISRQEFLGIYYLYFYICQHNRFNFDLGNLIISLLNYMVENGKLDFYAMKPNDIKLFIDKYFIEYNSKNPLSNEDINTLLNRLEGVNPDGTSILYKFSDKSQKVSYISFDIENNGYKITDMGLQFLISSKEVPQDSKVTISLYLFKLQIKKHKYQSALDTIKNVNMETNRQLSLKNKVLDIAHYDAPLGNKLYNDYWKDFTNLRDEERQYYQQAKDFLKEYQEVSQSDDITPKDREILRQIDVELNISTTLQNKYILEISSMGKELAELNINNMNNIFDTRFNFKEHFEKIYSSSNIGYSLISILTPMLLPKKIRFFDVSIPFLQQPVKSIEDIPPNTTETISYTDFSKLYENRKINNYLVLFEILIDILEKYPTCDIRKFIEVVKNSKGENAIQSIDFLAFLIDLSGFSEVNSSINSNIQTIHLVKNSSEIICGNFESMLSKFWFENLSKGYSANILISTNINDIVYLDTNNQRSIGNINLKLETLKGDF